MLLKDDGETKELSELQEIRARLPVKILLKYIIGKKIGSGSGGTVYLGYQKNEENTKVAIKVVSKSTQRNSRNPYSDARREGTIMTNLRHPCIIGLKEVVESEACVVIVLEYAKGGELFEYIAADFENKSSNERIAKLQFYQV
jgi:serine/threonine protein kinase